MTTCATIYHYTTSSGLIGIVTKHELWASECRFLNDGTELSYAHGIFLSELEKLSPAPLRDGDYIPAGTSLDRFRMFVACFCEEGDLLSQWRGYGTDQGYALGFDVAHLQSLNVGEIVPVQYGIPNPSEYFSDELFFATQGSGHPGMSEWNHTQLLLPRLARVKHPGFAEEHEWRVMKGIPAFELEDIGIPVQFRPSPMGPIAYLSLPFPPECLREIVIGPGNHIETRKTAIRNMLHCHNYKHVVIRVSTIPLRQ